MADFEARTERVNGLAISFQGVDFLYLGGGKPKAGEENQEEEEPLEEEPPIAKGPTLQEGARVRIAGLSERADLNGTPGTLVTYNFAEQRWQVRLDDDVQCMLLEANLEQVDLSQAVPGLVLLHATDAPHLYILHLGLDLVDEALTHAVMSSSIGHVCAVLHDNEAASHTALSRLAELCVKRILEEYSAKAGFAHGPLALAAASFGATMAQEVAIGLTEAGVPVEITFFGFEWLEAANRLLVADHREWLGDRVESILLYARSIGAHAWAEHWEALMTRAPPEQRDTDDMAMRLFWEHAADKGIPQVAFQRHLSNLAAQYERLNNRMENFTPTLTFDGPTRFVLAPSV